MVPWALLLEAERSADCDLYLTAKKHLATLFAGSHATRYVSMVTDFFVDWYCALDAEKIIFAKAIFTRKTKTMKTFFPIVL